MAAVRACCEGIANRLGCQADDILMASTGVIGEPLDTGVLEARFDDLATGEADWQDAARAIMTTDTFAKGASATTQIGGIPVTISGIAKGSGMIAPDMATMLGFIATDAAIPADTLAILLRRATATSFNAITVDSDSSTNDSVFLIASGAASHGAVDGADDPALDGFRTALDTVMQDLAQQIVRDGEGATKFVTVTVSGAADNAAAHRIGMAIANSPLVKTAIAGEDANWGRIVMAVGKAGEGIDQTRVSVSIGGILIAADGARVDGYDEAPVAAHMAGDSIAIEVTVGGGAGTARSGPAILPTATSRSMPTTGASKDDGGLPVVIVSAVALIDADGRALLARRPAGRRWRDCGSFLAARSRPGKRRRRP